VWNRWKEASVPKISSIRLVVLIQHRLVTDKQKDRHTATVNNALLLGRGVKIDQYFGEVMATCSLLNYSRLLQSLQWSFFPVVSASLTLSSVQQAYPTGVSHTEWLYTVIHNYGNPYEKWNIFVARPHLWLQLGMVKTEIMLCETVLNLSTLNTLTYLRTY